MRKTIDVGEVAKRSYWDEDDARVVVAAWESSGETLAAFARRHRVDGHRVSRWARRLAASAPLRFHPVRVTGAPEAGRYRDAIEIELPGGLQIRLPRGFATDDLQRVLAVVQAGLPC
jgi:hypothetical protein